MPSFGYHSTNFRQESYTHRLIRSTGDMVADPWDVLADRPPDPCFL